MLLALSRHPGRRRNGKGTVEPYSYTQYQLCWRISQRISERNFRRLNIHFWNFNLFTNWRAKGWPKILKTQILENRKVWVWNFLSCCCELFNCTLDGLNNSWWEDRTSVYQDVNITGRVAYVPGWRAWFEHVEPSLPEKASSCGILFLRLSWEEWHTWGNK